MDKLIEAAYKLVLDQNALKINALSSRIKKHSIEDAVMLNNHFATESANRALKEMLDEWHRVGCSSDEMAGIVRGVSHGYLAEQQREKIELVWTGPDLNQIPVRRSEQILLELINSAKSSLFVISFVLFNIPTVEEAIRQAIEREVDVRMLLESEDKDGSNGFSKTIERLQTDIPGLTLYVWPREKRAFEGGFARVHAKCAVADQANAFLTSANLTSAALDKNIEMGVHIQGGNVPLTIYQQFIAMIQTKEITPYGADRYLIKTSSKSKATALTQLKDNLEVGTEKLLSFQNTYLDVEEQCLFKVLGHDSDMPKQNSLVLIRHEGQWLVGKYAWSKQQDTDSGRVFYLVTVRGYRLKQKFEVEDINWGDFMRRAIEINP